MEVKEAPKKEKKKKDGGDPAKRLAAEAAREAKKAAEAAAAAGGVVAQSDGSVKGSSKEVQKTNVGPAGEEMIEKIEKINVN